MTIKFFQKLIWTFYKNNKRNFPWRETNDPYKIMVSEIMLQQTQTFRVLPKYEQFINRFPTLKDLADANFSEVIQYWSGLGYNRRALYLQKAAKEILGKLDGNFPQTAEELQKLPGIGPYTSRAIIVFNYNTPLPFIETNVRRVFIHHFFMGQQEIPDKNILPLVDQAIDPENPREWYYALMDYGANLTKTISNPNRQSKHYAKQSNFESSIRKVRGEIIRQLIKDPQLPKKDLFEATKTTEEKFNQAIEGLLKDKMITKKGNNYSIVT